MAALLSAVIIGCVFNVHAQNYSISPRTLTWGHDDLSTKSVYITNRDSLGVSLSTTSCPHFNVTPQQGCWRVDIAPVSSNNGASDIVQYLNITIDDFGTLINETVQLTQSGFTPSIRIVTDSLSWQNTDMAEVDLVVISNVPWTAYVDNDAFAVVNGTSHGSGTGEAEMLIVAPTGTNDTGTDYTGTVTVFGGTASATAHLRQKADPDRMTQVGRTYIRTTTYTSSDGTGNYQDITYYDGLGYPAQALQVAGSPSGKTVASQTVYDTMHRPDSVAYLPYVRGDGGAGELDAAHTLDDIGYWYHSACGDSRPYAVKTYESSQYGRLLSIQREGDEWNADGGHRTTFAYGFNAASDDVLRLSWKPGANAGDAPTVRCAGTWPEGSLSRTRLTDENGAVSDTYTDARGRTVCTRTWNGAASTAGGPGTGAMSETLYAYDYRDSLALVVQPEGAAALKALPAASRIMTIEDNAANANNTIYKEYCFGYIYDGWGNLIREHVPGGGTTHRSYDARDRLVLETNDLMAPRAIQTVYDNFDRVVQRRIVDANLSQVCPLYSAEYHPFGSVSGALTGFIADADVAEAAEVETENIKGMLKSETLYPAANADGTAPAGGITRTRNYWYDYRGRIIQIQESDSDGWTARYSTKYDFCGNVLATKETHTSPLNETHWLLTENRYDSRGRVTLSMRHLDGDYLRDVFYYYDDLGRLSRKEIGDGPDNIGNIAFDYDLHGWTTGIEARNNWGQDTVFRETLRYASPQKPGTMARYDGNISEITYTSYNGTTAPSSDTYGYDYDGLKRLTDAAHYAGAATTQSLLKTEKNITYDRNGNITGLNRYGAAGLSEMLSFTHAGNRLSSVQSWDGANLPQIGTFTYDAMGNQLTDSRKGLQFCYNFANLPSKVEGMAGSANAGLTLNYGYLSDGTKTSSIAGTGSSAEGLKYRGAFVYELKDGAERLSSVAWSDGRTEYDYSADASIPDISDQWHISDHLGNTRAVVNMSSGGTVVEQNDYLPFGTRLANPAFEQGSNRYRLGGKEEQRFGGLDLALSDFGARFYDPGICRWTSIDPMAEKFIYISPYSFCHNNPINYVDPTGCADYFDNNGQLIFRDLVDDGRILVTSLDVVNAALQEADDGLLGQASFDILSAGSMSFSSAVREGTMSENAALNVYEHYNSTGLPLSIDNAIEYDMCFTAPGDKAQIKINNEKNLRGEHYFDNSYNIVNAFTHEQKHLFDYKQYGRSVFARSNEPVVELRAINYQKEHSSWANTTKGYKERIEKYKTKQIEKWKRKR